MIAIVKYGSGNIEAIANIYAQLRVPYRFAECATDLAAADHVLLPGVGAFDQCMQRLNASGMREPLEEIVASRAVPVLGICVGMQLLARSSEEGVEAGLGWIDGHVRRRGSGALRLPHMGWNTIRPQQDTRLFDGVDLSTGFYFLHSYQFECTNPGDVLALADYGGDFACAVQHDTVFGVQFHPEKSHLAGITLLKNFAQL